MPDRSAVRDNSLGANHRDETQLRNAADACSRVIRNGRSALGLICFLLCAVATIAAPQNGHLFATTSVLNCDSAPHPTHFTVIASCVSACAARLFTVATKSSSATRACGSASIRFSAPQYGQ